MSGGSLDYVYSRLDDAIERIERDERPIYRAFAKHLRLVRQALHAIEWEYSNDTGPDDTLPTLEAVLGDTAKQRQMEEILEDIKKVAKEISSIKLLT